MKQDHLDLTICETVTVLVRRPQQSCRLFYFVFDWSFQQGCTSVHQDVMFASICCCSADGKDRRYGPTTNSRQMASALDVSVIAGLARCAHDLTSVPMQIVADTCIAAAESVLASSPV